MTFVGTLCLTAAIFCVVLSIVGGAFKFNIGTLISNTVNLKTANFFFNTYFFTKMLFVICSIILSFYLLFAFTIRYLIEFIELPDKESPFKEGRREMSNKTIVFNNLACNGVLVSANILHLLQMLYWLKLMSSSWVDLTCKNVHIEDDDDDDDTSF